MFIKTHYKVCQVDYVHLEAEKFSCDQQQPVVREDMRTTKPVHSILQMGILKLDSSGKLKFFLV